MEALENIAYEMILHAGNARSEAMEAIYESRNSNMEEAEKHLTTAKAEIVIAHQSQTQFLFQDVKEKVDMGVLLTHALDHISMASVTYDLAEEIMLLRKDMLELSRELKERRVGGSK